MSNAITRERWEEAQAAEATFHSTDYEIGLELYRKTYVNYFSYLGISPNQAGKRIVEIGCAAYPAIYYCEEVDGVVVEPISFAALERIVSEKNLTWIREPLEELVELPSGDEVWLLNVMQHILDPEEFVRRCKLIAPTIRFFEPINYPTCIYHPHEYSLDDFVRWFGESERYIGSSRAEFHQADCAFGVWRKERIDA